MDYHTVISWAPTGGEVRRHIPFDARWPYVYWNDGVLFQFADSFVAADPIRVAEHPGFVLPTIDSTPPASGPLGAIAYTPTATGDGPIWWSLAEAPTGARIDPATGTIDWTPAVAQVAEFTVSAEGEAGSDTQSFEYAAGCGVTTLDADLDVANIATLSSIGPAPQPSATMSLLISGFSESVGTATLAAASAGGAPLSAFGGTVYLDPSQIRHTTPVSIVNGVGTVGFEVPGAASGVGRELTLQVGMPDDEQPEGVALTQGLKVTICP